MVGEGFLARRRAAALIVIVIFILIALAPQASAHAASSVTCTYDFAAQELSVTVTHPAGDLSSHYIYSIEIRRNGVLVDNHSYTGQPSSTFTRVYLITAQDGDVFNVTTHCNLGGTRSGEVTVQETPSGGVAPLTPRPIWPFHAAFVLAGLSLMLVAIPVVRMKRKNWLKVHQALGISAAVLVAIGFAIGVYMAGGSFSAIHGFMGLITTIMAFTEPALGFGIFKAKKNKKLVRQIHIWFGRITPIMMVITILLGLFMVGII